MARIKNHLFTGVTLICSIVPVSFSLTMFSVGRKPVISISTIVKRAGIMKSLKFRCLL